MGPRRLHESNRHKSSHHCALLQTPHESKRRDEGEDALTVGAQLDGSLVVVRDEAVGQRARVVVIRDVRDLHEHKQRLPASRPEAAHARVDGEKVGQRVAIATCETVILSEGRSTRLKT